MSTTDKNQMKDLTMLFKKKGGNNFFFNLLDRKQLSEKQKAKHCDHVVVNEKNLDILKKKLLDILKKYE